MVNLNLTPTLNKQRPNSKGQCAIRVRQTIKRKVTYYPTGIYVLPEQWNGEVIKHPNKVLLNTSIRKQLNDIEKNYLEGTLPIKTKTDFYSYAEKKIEQEKNLLSKGTYSHKKSYLKKLKTFRPHLSFHDITPSFMTDFENYCKGLGNKPTTVWSSIKLIKTVINAAINENVISQNPFKGYKAKPYVNPERDYLTDEEILRIENFAATHTNETLVKVANWFLFGCYSGLRYADIKNFDRSKIVDDRIILRTEKAKTDVSIKLHPKLKNILDKISPKVFTNQKMNDYLKIVAERCHINKRLTFHVSRHTFAVYWLNHNGSMESLSKILGHTSTKTTAIYGKITNLRIDAEVDKVWK